MIRLVILGNGNVAKHLYTAFSTKEHIQIVQCYNRKGLSFDKEQNKGLVTTNLDDLKDADVYIMAISDDAISEVSKKLPFSDRLVVHTSGSTPMLEIDDKNNRGVFYPLQTFSKDKDVDFKEVPFCIEAENNNHLSLLKNLASILSEKVYEVSSKQRNILHVSAVFVNNFTNHLFTIGNEICEEHKVPFEILHPLILETAKKITEMPPNQSQTGPALRNDQQTIERHLNLITDNSQKEIYKILTEAIQLQYGKKL